MRRGSLAATAALLLLAFLPFPAGAVGDDVRMTLVSQTPWNTPKRSTLDVKVAVHNDGSDDLGNLALRATLWDALPNRSSYTLSLTEDVGGPVAPAKETRLRDDVPPGADLTFHLRLDIGFLEQQAVEARIYPLTVELLAGGETVAEIRTPAVFLPENPKTPLELVWTFVLGQPVTYSPDGTFHGRELERRLAKGGALRGEIEALAGLALGETTSPVDVALSPSLVDQLQRMQDGYTLVTGEGTEQVPKGEGGAADAADALARIKQVAAADGVELSALPYSSPDIPQLLASGLGKDLPAQLDLGRRAVQEGIGAETTDTVLRPPGSDVDSQTLSRLRAGGVKVLLLDDGPVEQPPQDRGFAPPATASFEAGGEASITAVAPDEGVQALISSPITEDDPRLAAQWVLGDLAAIWLEQPDESRSVAAIVSTEEELPGAFLTSFTRNVAAAPWLQTRTATAIADRFPAETGAARLRSSRPAPIPKDYLGEINDARAMIDTFRSVLVDPDSTTLPSRLQRDLLLSEGSALVANEQLGLSWISSIRERIADRFAGLTPDTSQVVTLTSRRGVIPLRIPNATGEQVHVLVRLVSSRLQFTGENPREVEPPKTLTFSVATRTTGTFPVQVVVESPTGQPLTEATLVVRSTAYSRIALYITLGAVAVLVGLWLRRLLWKRA